MTEILFATHLSSDSRIALLNLDTGNVRYLTDSEYHDDYPSWSPDKTKIVFVREDVDGEGKNRIMVMNADGSNIRPITIEFDTSASAPIWISSGK